LKRCGKISHAFKVKESVKILPQCILMHEDKILAVDAELGSVAYFSASLQT